jgi:hypothetical protein
MVPGTTRTTTSVGGCRIWLTPMHRSFARDLNCRVAHVLGARAPLARTQSMPTFASSLALARVLRGHALAVQERCQRTTPFRAARTSAGSAEKHAEASAKSSGASDCRATAMSPGPDEGPTRSSWFLRHQFSTGGKSWSAAWTIIVKEGVISAPAESRLTTRDAGDPRPDPGNVAQKLPRVLRPARRLSGDGPLLAHPGAVFWPAGPNRPSPRGCERPSRHRLPPGRRRWPVWRA